MSVSSIKAASKKDAPETPVVQIEKLERSEGPVTLKRRKDKEFADLDSALDRMFVAEKQQAYVPRPKVKPALAPTPVDSLCSFASAEKDIYASMDYEEVQVTETATHAEQEHEDNDDGENESHSISQTSSNFTQLSEFKYYVGDRLTPRSSSLDTVLTEPESHSPRIQSSLDDLTIASNSTAERIAKMFPRTTSLDTIVSNKPSFTSVRSFIARSNLQSEPAQVAPTSSRSFTPQPRKSPSPLPERYSPFRRKSPSLGVHALNSSPSLSSATSSDFDELEKALDRMASRQKDASQAYVHGARISPRASMFVNTGTLGRQKRQRELEKGLQELEDKLRDDETAGELEAMPTAAPERKLSGANIRSGIESSLASSAAASRNSMAMGTVARTLSFKESLKSRSSILLDHSLKRTVTGDGYIQSRLSNSTSAQDIQEDLITSKLEVKSSRLTSASADLAHVFKMLEVDLERMAKGSEMFTQLETQLATEIDTTPSKPRVKSMEIPQSVKQDVKFLSLRSTKRAMECIPEDRLPVANSVPNVARVSTTATTAEMSERSGWSEEMWGPTEKEQRVVQVTVFESDDESI
jgi:hypothetical protein